MLFSASRRPAMKAEQPELTFCELGKALGAEWTALDAAGKAPFNAAAATAKAEIHAKYGSATTPSKRAAAAPKVPKAPKFSGWLVFNAERRPKLKAEEPDLSFGDLAKRLSEEWKVLEASAKAAFNAQATARTTAAAIEFEANGGVSSSKTAPKAKRAKGASSKFVMDDETDESDDDAVYAEDPVDEEEDMSDGEEAEDAAAALPPPPPPRPRSRSAAVGDTAPVEDASAWGCDRSEAVQFLLARARSGRYVAVRELGGGVPTLETPVALRSPDTPIEGDEQLHAEEQEHEYEIAAAQFKAALAERSVDGSIDLDDLPEDSPLSAMTTIEMLRAQGGPLHEQALGRSKHNFLGVQDVLIKVPAIALSFIVQRLVTAAVAADRASRCEVTEKVMETEIEGDAAAPLEE
jgi:hypothetical protein